jgi:hypothetical protein
MFFDDIKLVTEQINKYGLRFPMADLGGLSYCSAADYEVTKKTGIQDARYVSLKQKRPFDHIDVNYKVLNPDSGDLSIENLGNKYLNHFGTLVCLNVIEHVYNPFEIFDSFFKIMKEDSLAIIETVFSFPYHPSPVDFWRYSPDCLKYLAEKSGFVVLEYGWRLIIHANEGILNTQDDSPQEIKSVYITLSKTKISPLGTPMSFNVPEVVYKNKQIEDIMKGV